MILSSSKEGQASFLLKSDVGIFKSVHFSSALTPRLWSQRPGGAHQGPSLSLGAFSLPSVACLLESLLSSVASQILFSDEFLGVSPCACTACQ